MQEDQLTPPSPDMISLEEAAELTGISVATIKRRIESGELKGYRRVGVRGVRVSKTQVQLLAVWRPV